MRYKVHPFESPGSSVVFYELSLLPDDSRTPSNVMDGLKLKDLKNVLDLLDKLEQHGIVKSQKEWKSKKYEIAWDKVAEYAVEKSFLPGVLKQLQGKEPSLGKVGHDLMTTLKQIGSFRALLSSYVQTFAEDVVKAANKKEGSQLFAIKPENAVGPILRDFFRELDDLFRKDMVKAANSPESRNLYNLLKSLSEFYQMSDFSASAAARKAVEQRKLLRPSGITPRNKQKLFDMEMGVFIETPERQLKR